MSTVKIWGTGKVITKGMLLEADKPTADILVSQGKASYDPVEKTKEAGFVPPVETENPEPEKGNPEATNPEPKKADKPTADKTKDNGKGK